MVFEYPSSDDAVDDNEDEDHDDDDDNDRTELLDTQKKDPPRTFLAVVVVGSYQRIRPPSPL